MVFSYSGIIGYGKTSLPSVESWGTNNNILRDPTRSITTRRIDKVTDNTFLNQEIQDSGDRVGECIRAYTRGSNPMVGVSYNNNGSQQAKLPYRVDVQGAFRPPVQAPVDLLPLSRFPRRVTTIDPTIYKPDFTKKISCQPDKRTIRESPLQVSCPSTLYFKVDQANEMDARDNIKDKPTYAVDSAVKYQRAGEQRSRYTTLLIRQNTSAVEANTNLSGARQYRQPEVTEEGRVRPTLRGEIVTNRARVGHDSGAERILEYRRAPESSATLAPDGGVYNVAGASCARAEPTVRTRDMKLHRNMQKFSAA